MGVILGEPNVNSGRPLIIVTGCGRSGTLYTSHVFSMFGLKVGHERFYDDGISSWYLAEEQRWKYLITKLRNHKYIVYHQVRTPLKVISSMMNRDAVPWLHTIVEEINRDDSKLLKCMKYYYYWNRKVEKQYQPKLRFKVEKLLHSIPIIMEQIGVEFTREQYKNAQQVSQTTHTAYQKNNVNTKESRSHKGYDKIISWQEVVEEDSKVADLLKNMIYEYGYEEVLET